MDLEQVMAKLESMQDEELAVELLADLNRSSAGLGKLLLNLDPSLSTQEWKNLCDKAQKEVDEVVRKINQAK